MPRTQAQVDALWQGDIYTIPGMVKVPEADTRETAAQVMQEILYDSGIVAGAFRVECLLPGEPGRFSVTFERYTGEDAEVLNAKLLAGKDFDAALMDQLRNEFMEATEGSIRIRHLTLNCPVRWSVGGGRKRKKK